VKRFTSGGFFGDAGPTDMSGVKLGPGSRRP
jgi:hypothetical protein